jgi:hypothetical protein
MSFQDDLVKLKQGSKQSKSSSFISELNSLKIVKPKEIPANVIPPKEDFNIIPPQYNKPFIAPETRPVPSLDINDPSRDFANANSIILPSD